MDDTGKIPRHLATTMGLIAPGVMVQAGTLLRQFIPGQIIRSGHCILSLKTLD
jgi:hypothetical protein